MEKTLRSKVSIKLKSPTNSKARKMAEADPKDVPWPSIAGPRVADKDPKLWKATKLDMNSSLAFLRGELAAMQVQDRALHKQLLALNTAISSLKTDLKESWEYEDQRQMESPRHPIQTPAVVTKVEVLDSARPESPKPRVLHVKQDSGFLTDEESDEERDVFDDTDNAQIKTKTGRSVSISNLSSFQLSSNTDMNNNFREWRSQSVRASSSKTNKFQSFNISLPRERSKSYPDGSPWYRVKSMPVINEIPKKGRSHSTDGKAFAFYGYKRIDTSREGPASVKKLPVAFGTLSRHESMPVISEFGSWRLSAKTEPEVTLRRGRLTGSFVVQRSAEGGYITRASSQLELRRTAWENISKGQRHIQPYKIYRSASQVSLV